MIDKIINPLMLELIRDKEVIQPLRDLLEKELIDRDYVRALHDKHKISQEELFKILST